MKFRQVMAASVVLTAMFGVFAVSSASSSEAQTLHQNRNMLPHDTLGSIVNGISTELRDGYVFPELGNRTADTLQGDLAAGIFAGVDDPAEFARQLTERLRALTNDSHVRVIYGDPFANRTNTTKPQGAGFDVRLLDGNVGYIHLASFVPPEEFKPAADAALRKVAATTALIFDMRDNGGGHPASVAYLTSFFLDPRQRVHINDLIWRNRGTPSFRTESFWSSPTPVSYLRKPIYVLVGPKTYSAGEEFAYDLQILKLATVVGETTRGGANPGGLTKLGSDFFVVVPTGRAENPISGGNWGGEGVHPDVPATTKATQEVALNLAKRAGRS